MMHSTRLRKSRGSTSSCESGLEGDKDRATDIIGTEGNRVTFRRERDSMGTIEVPEDVHWGAQTQRSLANFEIGEERMPPPLIHAYGLIKQAAARVNERLTDLSAEKTKWIMRAAEEVARGDLDAHFPLRVWQTGSGTQSNMNCNEVVAHRANELAGLDPEDANAIHPNDDVNRSQSTNDTFPTAMHLSVALAIRDELEPALDDLCSTLDRKRAEYAEVSKIGRTHLQDATPLTLGQEIGGWLGQIRVARRALEGCVPLLYELAAGGTAVGTGMNSPQGFDVAIAASLAEKTGLPLVSAPDKFAALAGHEAISAVSGALSTLAGALFKIAGDVALLASGPRCGLGEITIPANEPGSSIMPGKVNPTQAEALIMVCLRVFGNHTTVGLAASQGRFELNVCKPVIAHCTLQSIRLLGDAARSFDRHCVSGLEPDREVLDDMVERSLMLVTALAPHIGYEAASKIAGHAHRERISLKEAALSLELVSETDFDRWVRAEDMLGPLPAEND